MFAQLVVLQGPLCLRLEVLTGEGSLPRLGPACLPGQAWQTWQLALLTPVSSLAGPGEAVPEGFQRGCVLRGWRGLLPVQRVRALPGGAATAAHPHRCPDKAGAPGLGPASVPT